MVLAKISKTMDIRHLGKTSGVFVRENHAISHDFGSNVVKTMDSVEVFLPINESFRTLSRG
jgi:hypothetical protein